MIAKPLAAAGAALALATVLAACGGGAHTSSGGSTSAAAHGSDHSGGSADSAGSAGSAADIAYAQQMIPHHAQAIVLADLAASKAASPEVKALAVQIKAAQDPEIQVMNTWLTAWGAEPIGDMDGSDSGHAGHGMDMGDGMMSEQDMAALAALDGAAFDQMWLTMVVAHHEGAIAMAQQILVTSANAEVRVLAQAVIDGQSAEIATIQKLLST